MELSIIIVSYNTKDILKDCLSSIYETTKDINFEVIIVDNASIDGTENAISNLNLQDKNLIYVQNKVNLGFSKANNIGIKESTGKVWLSSGERPEDFS